MPDLRQALKDFVATSNSGKYADEATLLSKFPELKGYDVQALKDFVATSNSGKYATEDELFAKFPEFNLSFQQPTELKKKEDTTALPSELGSSVSSVSANPEMAKFGYQPGKPLPEQIPSVKPDERKVELEANPIISFGKKFWETLSKQIPSAMEAKGAQTQSQFVESDMRRLKSIADVSDDDIIEMPSLTDPRGGNLTSYKAGEYKKQLAEKIARGNKAMQASIELALKLNKDLSNSDVISSLTQVNDGYDLLNFISSSVGQTVAQVPLAIASGGGMSYAMESGNIYLETVKEIAEKEGITPVQVIQQGKDQVALAEIGGAISGALDLFGAKKILDAFGLDNIKKDLRKKALTILVNSQVEGATEVGQEFVSSAAKGLGVEGELRAPTLTQALDAYAAGMFGAAGVQSPSLFIGSKKDSPEEIVQPVILNYGDSKFGFIRDESGRMEMTKELDNEEQAMSMSNMLSKAYKGLQFTIEEIQPTDPYKPTKYKIVANEIAAQQEAPSYKVDGKDVSVDAIDELIKTKSREQLLAMNIDIKNDPEGRVEKLQAIINPKEKPTTSLTEEIAQDIAAQEEPVQSGLTPEQRRQQIESIELELKLDDRMAQEGRPTFRGDTRYDLEQELQTLKEEEDAFQKQAAGQVPVQSGTTVSQEVAQGEPQAGPQVTTEEGQAQEEVIGPLKDVESTALALNENLINRISEEANMFFPLTEDSNTRIAESYHKAKADGTNPNLVKAVEKVLGATVQEAKAPVAQEGQAKEEVVPSKTLPEFALELQDKYGVELDLLGGPESETLSLSRIIVPKEQRGKGVGAKVIEEVVQFADSNNKKLVLTPSKDFGGTSVKRLTDFYKRFGFVENKGKNKDFTIRDTMYRVPKAPAQAETAPAVSTKPAPVVKAAPVAKKSAAQAKRDEIISRPASTPISLARQWLLSGGKLLPKQSEENKRRGVGVGKGVQEETGMSGIEIRALGDVTNTKRGISIEMAAGKIWEGLSPEIQGKMDDTDIRNAMIDILMSENRKSWIENQDRDTSEDAQNLAREEFEYAQLTEQERADFDEYQQEKNYSNYLEQNAKRLAKEYDAYIKSKTYQDYIEETYERDRKGQNNAQNQNDGRGKKQGPDAGTAPVQGREQAAKAPEVEGKLDELLKLDPEDKGTGKKALDYLDGLIKNYEDIEKEGLNLGIALSAIKEVLKGIRALVQAGITLSDAIKQVARDNNVSVKDITDGINTINQIIPIQAGFNNLMDKADALIARQKAKGVEEKKIISNLDTMVRKDRTYINGTDAQRKIMEREARAKIGAEPRKAASIGRVIGVLKDIANVTREEKLKIISRIRELGRDVAKDLAAEIRAMAKGGTITANQSADIIARFGKVNMLNEKSVSNFVDYMAKVFADAEYTSQLKNALSIRKRLRSLSKNKDKAANLKTIASKFVEIDPSMVDDIYEYNKIAKMIEQSVEGSSIKGKDVKFANIVQEEDVMPYINKTLDAQRKKLFDEKLKEVQDIISEIQDILGVEAKDLSYEDLLDILSSAATKGKGKDNDKLVRDAINKAFDVYSSIIKAIIKTGVDPFSGQDVKYTDAQKKIISDFMDMDLNIIPTKQALEAVDAALNFLQNKSTAKMEAIFKAYMGEKNARELEQKGIKASPLRKYFSKGLGRFFGEQTTNLGLLFERLFKGFEAGGVVQDAMGLTDLINGKSQAQNETNRIINDYVNEFYKKKANNEAFNTELNNVERGMAAFMMRNVIGTASEIKAEFNRRKNLIKESIEELANGNEKEVAKSLIYQDVYDNILKDAKTVDDVVSKVDGVNLAAVKFWQNQWQGKYDELSDVSVNVYNKILEKDTDYTPDKYGKLSTSSGASEITENDMAFHTNNGTLYKKETGVLMEATRPNSLPIDNTTGEVDRYIDLSFDSNNANSMYDALVDIKTAGPIRQVQAFLNSKSFKKIFPNAEDAAILKGDAKNKRVGRIELFTRNFRNKNPYSEDEFSNAVRNLNRIANIGVSQALGGIFQPIKQVIPAGMNTLINGGSLDINAMTNPDKIKFMKDSGYAIGLRGVESQAQVESLNRLMDVAAKSKGEAAIKYIEEANKIWLKVFLVKPDVFIARASWMTYYEQSLGKQGIDANGIDYKTHKLNEKAANYAQRMVDRQQNVSDADLSGKLFSEKNPGKQVMMKVFMPFASFRMNQSARLGADIATITSKVSTQEDRKIAARSLAGFGVEMITFRALSIGISLLTASVVAQMMGSEEEDEEKKKKSIMKGQATNTVSDILSPIPFTDPIIQAIAATTLQSAQDIAGVDEEEMISIFSPQEKGYLEQIGLFGFAAQRIVQTGELIWMSTVGHYRDDFGKKKYVSEEDKGALRLLIGPAILTNMGLAPSEMNSVVRASMSAAKKNSSTKEGGSASGKDYESQMLDIMEEDLLEGYENKTDLKRYNPRLYEQNFGEGSEYYELTKEKREEQKKLDEEKQKEKDAEYGYKGKGFGSRSKSSSKGFGSKGFGKN